jgi:hypothetical protein
MRPTAWLRLKILEVQQHRCFACEEALEDVEFDHVIPLAMGGLNNLDNWAALCASCHRSKTKTDLRRIAKAKRQRRFHETGRSRKLKASRPFGGALRQGFNKAMRRHLNGVVSPRAAAGEGFADADK